MNEAYIDMSSGFIVQTFNNNNFNNWPKATIVLL